MISRIRLKNPIWVVDPDKVHELLNQVEAQMGGCWETDATHIEKGLRIYAFIRVTYSDWSKR